MSRRDAIRMSDDEVRAFLDEERVMVVATNGKDGFPHLMPLWFVVRDDVLWAWTYGTSQKVRNLERDPRATVQLEAGVEYQELRGVMFKCEVALVTDTAEVEAIGRAIFERYTGVDELPGEVGAMVAKQASKRVALRFAERERATWDHRKLATGVY